MRVATSQQGGGRRPFVFTNIKSGEGVEAVVAFVEAAGGLKAAAV